MANEQEQTPEKSEKKSSQVVVDNTNLAAVLADARGEQPPKEESKVEKPIEETKAETKPNGHDDEEEGEDGLTNTQREDPALTEKMKRAIGKQFRKRKEAEELAESEFNRSKLESQRAERLEREVSRLKEQLAPPKIEETKEPDRANFKTDKEYADAMIDYRVDQRLKAKEAADHKKAIEDRNREIQETAVNRIAEARKIVPDFDEVLASVNDDEHPVSDTIAGYMQESELFAELGYHFAKNPEVLDSIMKLTPAKQLVAIGKIEAILKPFGEPKAETSTGAKPETKTEVIPSTNAKPASKARPEPIKPIETGGTAQVEKPVSEMNFQEYKAHWEKSHKVKLGLRKRH